MAREVKPLLKDIFTEPAEGEGVLADLVDEEAYQEAKQEEEE